MSNLIVNFMINMTNKVVTQKVLNYFNTTNTTNLLRVNMVIDKMIEILQ